MAASRAGTPRYWELTVPSSSAIAEGLTNFLWELGALGVVEEERPRDGARLRAFFSDAVDAGALGARVREYLASLEALGFGRAASPRVETLVGEGWADAWRAHFRPVRVGRRLVVVPPWEQITDPGRVSITIDPGRAFGTGHHATTAGCLAAVEALVEREPAVRVLDLGCGSGILGIAAARLGAGSVFAVDTDPDAVAATAANAALNHVADRLRAEVADVGTIAALEAAPLVLANLLAAAHVSLAARYAELVTPRGTLVLGGILDAESRTVEDAVRCHGFTPAAVSTIDGWTTLVSRRDAASGPREVGAPTWPRPIAREGRRPPRTPPAPRSGRPGKPVAPLDSPFLRQAPRDATIHDRA